MFFLPKWKSNRVASAAAAKPSAKEIGCRRWLPLWRSNRVAQETPFVPSAGVVVTDVCSRVSGPTAGEASMYAHLLECWSLDAERNGNIAALSAELSSTQAHVQRLMDENNWLVGELAMARADAQIREQQLAGENAELVVRLADAEALTAENAELRERVRLLADETDTLAREISSLKEAERVEQVEDALLTKVLGHNNWVGGAIPSCPVTTEPIEQPLMLGCGHVFESGMLHAWWGRSQTCPTCRQPTRIRFDTAIKTASHTRPSPSPCSSMSRGAV